MIHELGMWLVAVAVVGSLFVVLAAISDYSDRVAELLATARRRRARRKMRRRSVVRGR